MSRKSLGGYVDYVLVCLISVTAILLFLLDIDVKNLFQHDNNEVTRLLSFVENPKEILKLGESSHFTAGSEKDYEKCTHFNCFDIYQCGVHHQKLLVHVPEPKQFVDNYGNPVAPYTQDFVSILEAIAASDYYTENYDEACVFIPAIDLLNQRNLKVCGKDIIINKQGYFCLRKPALQIIQFVIHYLLGNTKLNTQCSYEFCELARRPKPFDIFCLSNQRV